MSDAERDKLLAELTDLVELLETQDNAITSDPLFTVQRKHRQYGMDTDYCENFAWFDAEEPSHPVCDDDPEEHSKYELLEKAYDGTIDWPETFGSEEMWSRTGYIDRWEFVQAFLTREAAEAYRRNQAHNLGETRVYVESGYNNPEWKRLRALPARVLGVLAGRL
jgi:hypothetical protein